jgi:hypothetical protein
MSNGPSQCNLSPSRTSSRIRESDENRAIPGGAARIRGQLPRSSLAELVDILNEKAGIRAAAFSNHQPQLNSSLLDLFNVFSSRPPM